MLKRMTHFFAPPVFADDEEKTRNAYLLNVIALSVFLGALLYRQFAPMEYILIIDLEMGVALASWLVMRGGYGRGASLMIVTGTSALLAISAFISDGVRAPLYSGFFVTILLGGLLLGWRGATGVAIFSILYGMILLQAEALSLLPESFEYGSNAYWVIDSILFIITGTMITLALQMTNQALRRANIELAERKQAETALRASEERYRLIVDTALDAVMAIDADGRITHWNAQAEQIFGWPRQEALGQRLADTIIPPQYRDAHRRGLAHFQATGEGPLLNKRFEITALRRDGQEFPVELAISPMPSGDGITFNAFVRDITTRKQAEEELRASEARFRALFEYAPDGILIADLDSYYLDANASMCRMLGYTRDELIGRHASDIVAPSEIQHIEPALEAIKAQSEYHREWQFRRKDGSVFAGDVSVTLIPDGNLLALIRDITARRQAEEELRASEARFRTLFEHAPNGIFVVEPDGTYIDVNESGLRVLGYTRAEFIGMRVFDILHEAESPRVIADLAKIEAGLPYSQEWQFKRKDGSVFDGEILGAPLPNGNLMGFVRNITERKQAQAALQQFREVMDESNEAIFLIDPETSHYLDFNQTAVNYLGYSRTELLQLGVMQIAQHVPTLAAWRERVALIKQTNRLIFETIHRRKDGTLVPVEVSARMLDYGGRMIMVAVVHDITERQQAEAEIRARGRYLTLLNDITRAAVATSDFQSMLQTLADRLSELLDADGCYITLWDEAQQRTRPAAAYGPLSEVYPALVPQPDELTMTASVMRAGHALAAEDALNSPYISPRIAAQFPARSLLGLPLIAHEQKLGAALIGFNQPHHFTPDEIARGEQAAAQIALAVAKAQLLEQVQQHAAELEQRMAERTAQLSEANKELEAFSYFVSHDLRAPLRAIGGFSQILLDDQADRLDTDGRHYLEQVRAASQRMGQLIEDLLRLSHVSRAELHRRPVSLSMLAQTVIGDLRQAQPERVVDCVIAAELEGEGDEKLLRIVLENLLGNAWKFTGQQPQARVEFGREEREGPAVYFVRDNGAGFDMAYAHKLFGAFQRLHTESEFPGTGIGLATIQRIVHRHGGRIWAESAVGQGATFYFTLG